MIVLKSEAMFIRDHQVVFEGCFEITNEGQIMSRLFNEVGHHLCLHGPLNHLSREWGASYVALMLCQIVEFLDV